MRILFDQGIPVPLRRYLPGHSIVTAFEMSWSQLVNGELLAKAEDLFDVVVTTDKNLRYQQNLASRKIAVVVLPFTSWPKLQMRAEGIASAIEALQPSDYIEL